MCSKRLKIILWFKINGKSSWEHHKTWYPEFSYIIIKIFGTLCGFLHIFRTKSCFSFQKWFQLKDYKTRFQMISYFLGMCPFFWLKTTNLWDLLRASMFAITAKFRFLQFMKKTHKYYFNVVLHISSFKCNYRKTRLTINAYIGHFLFLHCLNIPVCKSLMKLYRFKHVVIIWKILEKCKLS